MKMLDIAGKDLLRAVRSFAFVALGFAVPLLVSGIFYFAFGNVGAGGDGFDLPTIRVQVVNLDEGGPGFAAGQMLVQILTSEDLTSLFQVTQADDPARARAAVDRQDADVAILIPADLTAALFDPGGRAAVELYQDPTQTLGPGIVKGLVQQFVDGFAGSKIVIEVARQQFGAHGQAVSDAAVQALAAQYGVWAADLGSSQQGGTTALVEVRPPAGAGESADLLTSIVSMIMAGMMVFFVFFSGATTVQTLLQEEEGGTLARLFTTPTPISAVLGGRILASLVTLVLQVVVLLVASALIFGIHWGQPLPLALTTLGLVLLAASFGLFLASMLRSTRQGGVVFGGVLTILGMVGMINIFTAGAPSTSRGTLDIISHLTPHGWAVDGYLRLLDGGGLGDVLLPVAVTLALAAAFFLVGLFRFRKRFA
ncbi:MAG: ABC transporter permease [Anaerolineae bacterium]